MRSMLFSTGLWRGRNHSWHQVHSAARSANSAQDTLGHRGAVWGEIAWTLQFSLNSN